MIIRAIVFCLSMWLIWPAVQWLKLRLLPFPIWAKSVIWLAIAASLVCSAVFSAALIRLIVAPILIAAVIGILYGGACRVRQLLGRQPSQ